MSDISYFFYSTSNSGTEGIKGVKNFVAFLASHSAFSLMQ